MFSFVVFCFCDVFFCLLLVVLRFHGLILYWCLDVFCGMGTFIVTGGAGFIGSNLSNALLSRYHKVVVFDSFHTGSREVAEFLRMRGASIVEAGSGEIGQVREDVDCVFHLGMPSSSPMYREDPLLVGRVVEDAIAVFEYARRNDVKVVYASTSSLYNPSPPPHREDLPVVPSDFYTEARYYVERLGWLYHDLYGLEVVGLRLFSVYGPNEKAKGVYANIVSQMVWAALEGRKFLIYGDGSQTRDFVYVSDVVDAFLRAWECDVSGVFNVGTGVETSFNEALELVREVTGRRLEVEYTGEYPKNYVYRTRADTRLAEEKLGFRAKVSLREGLEIINKAYRKSRLVLVS